MLASKIYFGENDFIICRKISKAYNTKENKWSTKFANHAIIYGKNVLLKFYVGNNTCVWRTVIFKILLKMKNCYVTILHKSIRNELIIFVKKKKERLVIISFEGKKKWMEFIYI